MSLGLVLPLQVGPTADAQIRRVGGLPRTEDLRAASPDPEASGVRPVWSNFLCANVT